MAEGADERTVVCVFLYLLTREKPFGERLSRTGKRVVVKAYKGLADVPEHVRQRIEAAVRSCTRPPAPGRGDRP